MCILEKKEKREKAALKNVKTSFPPHGVWVRHQVDLVDMRHAVSWNRRLRRRCRWILHIRDHGSRFSYLVPLEAKASRLVAVELVHFFRQYGPPAILQSDNGTEFTANSLVVELQKLFKGLRLIRGRPRRPQTQGLVERANREVKGLLRKTLIESNLQPHDWAEDEVLDKVMFSMNATINATSGHSPANLVFGRRFRMCLWEGQELAEDAVLAEEALTTDAAERLGAHIQFEEDQDVDDDTDDDDDVDEDLDRNFFGTTAGVQPEWDAPDELRIAEAADADAIANADVNDEAGTTKRKADGGNEAGAGATRPKRRRK